MPSIKFELSIKQTEAWDILEQPDVKSLLFGGAKGGGKHKVFILWLPLLQVLRQWVV